VEYSEILPSSSQEVDKATQPITDNAFSDLDVEFFYTTKSTLGSNPVTSKGLNENQPKRLITLKVNFSKIDFGLSELDQYPNSPLTELSTSSSSSEGNTSAPEENSPLPVSPPSTQNQGPGLLTKINSRTVNTHQYFLDQSQDENGPGIASTNRTGADSQLTLPGGSYSAAISETLVFLAEATNGEDPSPDRLDVDHARQEEIENISTKLIRGLIVELHTVETSKLQRKLFQERQNTDAWKTRIAELEGRFKDTLAENEQLRATVRAKEEEVKSYPEKHREWKRKVEEVTSRMERQNERLGQMTVEAESKARLAEAALRPLTSELDQLKKTLAETQQELAREKECRIRLEELAKQAEEMAKSTESDKAALETTLANVRRQKDDLYVRFKASENLFEGQKREVAALAAIKKEIAKPKNADPNSPEVMDAIKTITMTPISGLSPLANFASMYYTFSSKS